LIDDGSGFATLCARRHTFFIFARMYFTFVDPHPNPPLSPGRARREKLDGVKSRDGKRGARFVSRARSLARRRGEATPREKMVLSARGEIWIVRYNVAYSVHFCARGISPASVEIRNMEFNRRDGSESIGEGEERAESVFVARNRIDN